MLISTRKKIELFQDNQHEKYQLIWFTFFFSLCIKIIIDCVWWIFTFLFSFMNGSWMFASNSLHVKRLVWSIYNTVVRTSRLLFERSEQLNNRHHYFFEAQIFYEQNHFFSAIPINCYTILIAELKYVSRLIFRKGK